MLKLETIQNIADVEAQAAASAAVAAFRSSRQDLLDNAIVTTAAGNQYNADERSISRMANALLAMVPESDTYVLQWSMADTDTGVMTATTKADLAEAHRLAVENMAAIWGRP